MEEKPGKQDPDAVRPGSKLKTKALRTLSAEELALRSQQGSRASFAELVKRFGMPLFDFLRYKINSLHDAEGAKTKPPPSPFSKGDVTVPPFAKGGLEGI